MRLGILARSEMRGLGLQTLAVARHLNPERVLLVQPTPNRHPMHPEWYEPWDTTVAEWRHKGADYVLDPNIVRPWLDGLDVVYTAESCYDWDLPLWATKAGCRVVCHANPELLPPQAHHTPDVVWWAPTPWLLDRLPAGCRVVPLPVDTAAISPAPDRGEGPLRFVHVGGHAAMLDRNGTRALAVVVRSLRGPADLLVTAQDGALPRYPVRDRRVQVRTVPYGFDHYSEAFVGDVLVMPRRYGGLSMPVQEAMAAGMCALMPACSPNDVWPGPRFPVSQRRDVPMLGGIIPVHDPDVNGLRVAMEALIREPNDVAAHKADARRWAAEHSWDALLPRWVEELTEAAR